MISFTNLVCPNATQLRRLLKEALIKVMDVLSSNNPKPKGIITRLNEGGRIAWMLAYLSAGLVGDRWIIQSSRTPSGMQVAISRWMAQADEGSNKTAGMPMNRIRPPKLKQMQQMIKKKDL